MPAYDTPPPPPTAVLREQPLRTGFILPLLGALFVAGLFTLLGVRRARLEREAAPLREKGIAKTAKLAQAALLYAEDNGAFHSGYEWHKALKPYGITFASAKSPVNTWGTIAMRASANRRSPSQIKSPSTFALFFDGGSGGSMTYAIDPKDVWWSAPYRKDSAPGNVFSFADGHATFIPQNAWNSEEDTKGPVR